MPSSEAWAALAARLTTALKPVAEPIGIAFLSRDQDAPALAWTGGQAVPNEAGRTGAVTAGCVFWMRAAGGCFSTQAADHANCSVGSYTHGFLSLSEAARKDDVAAVLASGWVSEAALASLPRVTESPHRIVYGPLAQMPIAPDVVLVRINGLGLMTLQGSLPGLRIEGKPQCHIVAIAREGGEAAVSVGCALSRSRTGMRPEEMTCALPASQLRELLTKLEAAADLDRAMARYASADARRFSSSGGGS